MDDAHKAWFLRPEALMSLAHTICDAAAPPLPQYDPDASLAEQAEQVTDWLIDSAYEDAHRHCQLNDRYPISWDFP
jgi:hypothetical protein